MTRAEQVTAGDWQAEDYQRNARFVADLAVDLLDWLEPRPGERILDLGCGDGTLSERIAAAGAEVIGVDGSPAMVEAAKQRGLQAVEADAQRLAQSQVVGHDFDAVFSNAALHWMSAHPQAVVEAVFARLKPGGRFVAEMGAAGNVAPIQAALRAEAAERGFDPDALDPWYFPAERDYCDRLVAAGFKVECTDCFERPTPLPGDVAAWLTTLARPFVTAFVEGEARDRYVAAVRARLADTLQDDDGRWTAPYVRLRFIARKPTA
ncbi:methyltransferase [Salinisphaera sp. SPP-AMP-43]|uniref:class I SAM-dependent methyltransferase n=1 Tax=Salinisphaera sp. SPP-AMP-43 TaxID=3121288 RepID=UPI003C6E77AC